MELQLRVCSAAPCEAPLISLNACLPPTVNALLQFTFYYKGKHLHNYFHRLFTCFHIRHLISKQIYSSPLLKFKDVHAKRFTRPSGLCWIGEKPSNFESLVEQFKCTVIELMNTNFTVNGGHLCPSKQL